MIHLLKSSVDAVKVLTLPRLSDHIPYNEKIRTNF